jgi:hypothetical protein
MKCSIVGSDRAAGAVTGFAAVVADVAAGIGGRGGGDVSGLADSAAD